MRIEASRRRASLYDELMQTHSNNDKLFYKLVAAQRSSSRSHGTSIMVDDRLLTDEADITDAWADHFELLGRPLEDDSSITTTFYKSLMTLRPSITCHPVQLHQNSALMKLRQLLNA